MRLFKYALKNMARNKFLSFSTVLVITLMAFFINVLFFVEYVAGSLIGNVSDRLSITLNLKSGYSDTSRDVLELFEGVRAIDRTIEAKYVPREEAFEILKKRDPELAKVIETDKDNPLPNAISLRNVPIARYGELDTAITAHKAAFQFEEGTGRKSVVDYRAQYEKIITLTGVLVSVRYGIYSIIGLFLFAVAAIVYNSIGNSVFFFREEIRIIGLVGGDKRFVYGPFAIQGFLYAAIAAALAFGAFAVVIRSVNFSLLSDFPIFVDRFFLERQDAFLFVALGLGLSALFSGFLSSLRFSKRSES